MSDESKRRRHLRVNKWLAREFWVFSSSTHTKVYVVCWAIPTKVGYQFEPPLAVFTTRKAAEACKKEMRK